MLYKYHTKIPSMNIKELEKPTFVYLYDYADLSVSSSMLTSEEDTSVSSGGMAVISNILYLNNSQRKTNYKNRSMTEEEKESVRFYLGNIDGNSGQRLRQLIDSNI